MSDFVDNMSSSITITSYFGFAIVILLIVAAITWYTTTIPRNQIPNNQQSQQRIQTLADLFTSTLGPAWPVLLIVFAVILILIAILLFPNFLQRNKSNVKRCAL